MPSRPQARHRDEGLAIQGLGLVLKCSAAPDLEACSVVGFAILSCAVTVFNDLN